MSVIRTSEEKVTPTSEEKVTPERYCSGCHPYGWPNGPMPHEPGCTAAPVIRPSNTLSVEQQLVAGIRTAMAYLEGNPPMVSAALERLQEANDAYANAPETGCGCVGFCEEKAGCKGLPRRMAICPVHGRDPAARCCWRTANELKAGA